ncbi:MAG: glycosyltransferase 87 family protein [Promethearchaeota archaeon]
MSINENDYLSFYYAGRNVIENLPKLYSSSLSPFPFRYLPLSAYFFTPFSLLGLRFGYFIFQIFNFFLNLLLLHIMYRIIKKYSELRSDSNIHASLNNFRNIFNNQENESVLHQYSIYLIMLPQFMNYFLGQINLIVLLFILSSVLYFLKEGIKNDLIGGFFIGLSLLFKPTLILILPFLVVLHYNKGIKKIIFNFKKTAIRLLGSIVLLLISGIYFLIYSQMFTDFIAVNLTGEYTYTTESGLEINPSFSFTRILLILIDLVGIEINGFLIFLVITLIFFIPIYYYYIQISNQQKKIINGYLVGIVLMLIVYFDSWPHHIIVLAPFLILFILFEKNFKYSKLFKYLHYLIAFLIVGFWGIYYLTYQLFPFNLGGLILMVLLYACLISYYVNHVKVSF